MKGTCLSLWYSLTSISSAVVRLMSLASLRFIHSSKFNTQHPPPCISYANVHNYYGPYAYCSLDKGMACAQHIQLPTHTYEGHMC